MDEILKHSDKPLGYILLITLVVIVILIVGAQFTKDNNEIKKGGKNGLR